MTPTDCSPSSAGRLICNTRQSSNTEGRLQAEGPNAPVLTGLSCSMDVSKLLVALTAPLVNSTAATTGSDSSIGVSGDGSDGDNNSEVPTNGHSGEMDSEERAAAEGGPEGRKEPHEKQQRPTATQRLGCPTSCAMEHVVATAGADDSVGLAPALRENGTGERSTKGCDGEAGLQEEASVRAAGVATADEVAMHGGAFCRRNVGEDAFVATGLAVPTTVLLRPPQQGGDTLSQQNKIEVQQAARRLTECCSENHADPEYKSAQGTHVEATPRPSIIESAPPAARCSGTQQPPSPESAQAIKAAAMEKEEAAVGDTAAAEGKVGGSVGDGGVPCGDAKTQERRESFHPDTVKEQRLEHEQQKMPSTVFPITATMEQSPHQQQQQRADRCHRQQSLSEGKCQDAQQELTQEESQQEQQYENHRRHGQRGDMKDRRESRGQLRAGDEGEKETCGVLATGVAQSGGAPGNAEGDACEQTEISDAASKQESACAAPPAQQEGQLLPEKLGQPQKAGCRSEDTTGSPSKRTSFEDAVEETGGTMKQDNSARVHQGQQQQRTLKELKQQLLQQFSPKEEVEGHIEYELKKSVTAVLTAALGGREANNGRDTSVTSYPLSPASPQGSTECFTTCSFETAASSQSQSPVELQKEEAPEGTKRDSTNSMGFSSSRSASNSKSEHSDSPFSVPHSGALDKSSVSRASSSDMTSSTGNIAARSSAVPSGPATESNSASSKRSGSDISDACCTSSTPYSGDGSSTSDESSMSGSSSASGGSTTRDSSSAYDTRSLSGSSRTSGTSTLIDANNGHSCSSASSGSGAADSGVAAHARTQSKKPSVTVKSCRLSQDGGSSSSSSAAGWTSAIAGAALLEDCVHSVIDLERYAARVLMQSPPEEGGGKQILLPSLLLQKTTLSGDAQLTECGLWGGKREKEETLGIGRTSGEVVYSGASSFGFYPPALGDTAVGVRKDPAGAQLVPLMSDENIGVTAADAHACRLLQEQLVANPLSAADGAVLEAGTITDGNLGMPGAAGTETAAGILEESLSHVWMLQQRGSCLGTSLPPATPCSFQVPSTQPASLPWAPPGTTSNIGAVASVARTPAATAVAAAALLPRSFRSRSDYLSLCSLQGCPATQENERKPRTLEELRQLPAEEHISLQEMHLLAENLVHDFMKLHHSSMDIFTSSKGSSRGGQRGGAQKSAQQDSERSGAVPGAAAATISQRAEPLVLHYRRDNLSFSVTPASAFTPYPPSVFEGTRKKTHLKNAGGSRVAIPGRSSMDEMEEEKKETLLGARYFTSPDFCVDSSCSLLSSERAGTRRETASRGQSKSFAAEGARTQAAVANEAHEFFPPQATTHLFRARCQPAGTEIGISDSTIGAVDRAFADATTSFFRESQRQNVRFDFCTDRTKQVVSDEQEGKQHRSYNGGKAMAEESCGSLEKADMRVPSTRTVGTVARGYHRLVRNGSGGADWRHERIN